MHTGQGSNPGPHELSKQLLIQTFLPTLVLGLNRQTISQVMIKAARKCSRVRPYTCDKLDHSLPEQLPVAGVQAGAPHAAQYLRVVLEVETRHVTRDT